MILFAQLLFLTFMSFVPVWCGGQAMTCYNQGHLWRSVACVAIATIMNVGLIFLVVLYAQYGWTFVTLLRFV